MKNIEQQIISFVSYRNVALSEIANQTKGLKERVKSGLDKMKESGLFSDEEIKQIETFAYTLIEQKETERKHLCISDFPPYRVAL